MRLTFQRNLHKPELFVDSKSATANFGRGSSLTIRNHNIRSNYRIFAVTHNTFIHGMILTQSEVGITVANPTREQKKHLTNLAFEMQDRIKEIMGGAQ